VHVSGDVTTSSNQIESTLRMRFLFYSHDGPGLGYTRRNLAIASALTALEPRASVLLAVGADYVSGNGLPPRVDILKLPGLRKITNGHYSARHLCIPVEVGARGGSTSRQSETLQNFSVASGG
jgi:predicted glycosyltransferase